jgi:TolB protein
VSTDRKRLRWFGALIALSLPLAIAACGDDNGTTPPSTGSLEVSSVTTGSDIDADGYTVTVDAGSSQAIDANGTVTFSNLSSGDHEVALSGVAANCTVAGDNPRTVTVVAGSTASTTFSVSCSAITGDLDVTAATTGDDLDDAYTVTVDAGAAQPIGANATITIAGLSAGNHDVELGDVAANCTVAGDNPRTVLVPDAGTVATTFDVACTAEIADLTVGNTTSGNGAPAGYDFSVDGGAAQALAANTQEVVAGVAVGDHTVELLNVPANCTVAGDNPRTVAVTTTGGTTTFDVTCEAGSLTVDTHTLGLGLDTGYNVAIGGGTPAAVDANGSTTFADTGIGDVTVELQDVAANCTVSGDNPRTVTLTDGVTSTTQFDVACFQTLSGKIAFESDKDGDREVYIMNPNGSGQENVTNDRGAANADGSPDVAPDGSAMLFESDRAGGNFDVWKLSLAGLENLTASAAVERDPSYAGDFTGIAFARKTSSTNWTIWKMNVNGTTPLAVSSGVGNDTQPAYSPDGQWILFRSDRDGDGEIYVVNVSSGVETRLTVDGADDGKPAWNNDGSAILWVSNRSGDYEIYTAAFTAGAPPVVGLPTNLTNNAANDIMPDVSTDGSQIAFASDRSGAFEVYTMNSDGTGQTASTAAGANNLEPNWSP